MSDRPILMVVTAADRLPLADGSDHPTGFWVSEVTEPYEVLTGAGHDVVIATPGARPPTPDPRSVDDDAEKALASLSGLGEPHGLSEVEDVTAYAAVVLPGGHGPMMDLATDLHLGRILQEAADADVPVAAICHGPAGLLAARQNPEGRWPFAGRRLTAFSDAEEGDLRGRLLWSLEAELRAAGADLVLADRPFAEHVVVDGTLVSGQNPASAGPAAEALVELLRSRG